jgi:hypothetical protein
MLAMAILRRYLLLQLLALCIVLAVAGYLLELGPKWIVPGVGVILVWLVGV